jgi:2'-5' RNA ligase
MNYNPAMTETAILTDLSFADYNNRQLYEVSAERNRDRALNTKPAGNFVYQNNNWLPQEYEGFAIASMLSENEGNEALREHLLSVQEELKYNLQPAYGFYQLPAESFHQTIANTLSADRFKQHILYAGLEEAYPEIVERAFEQITPAEETEPLRMKMVGLSIFGTAIGMLGVFENEADYDRVTRFRAGFYGDRQLSGLDVRMTRPFIGHVTLTYIEHSLNKNQKDQLAIVVNEINESLSNQKLYFNITHTGLRRYHHLAEFNKQANYPDFKL